MNKARHDCRQSGIPSCTPCCWPRLSTQPASRVIHPPMHTNMHTNTHLETTLVFICLYISLSVGSSPFFGHSEMLRELHSTRRSHSTRRHRLFCSLAACLPSLLLPSQPPPHPRLAYFHMPSSTKRVSRPTCLPSSQPFSLSFSLDLARDAARRRSWVMTPAERLLGCETFC